MLTHFSGPLSLLTLTSGTTLAYRYVTLPGDPFSEENALHVTWWSLGAASEPGGFVLFGAGLLCIAAVKAPSTCSTSCWEC